MKRLAALLPLLLILLTVPCSAAGDLYAEYTPKSENSSLFYIDIYTDRQVAAAVMELSFDTALVSYRSASSDRASATVRDRAEDGRVRVAIADTEAVSGKLCRLSFKALQAGEAVFTLRMEQAADDNKQLLTGWSDYTLRITFGEDDVASSSSGSRSARVSSAGASSRGGGRSSVQVNDGGGETPQNGEEAGSSGHYGVFDVRKDHSLKWMLIGAAIPIVIGMLLFIGFIFGKKSKASSEKRKEPEPEADGHEDSDHTDET